MLMGLPTFTFEWVKQGRLSILEMRKDFITEGDRFSKGQDHSIDGFIAKAVKGY